jgi:Glycosyl hydrolases family 2, TIM barrel domain/Glycosyl hydrolases family 2, sugar binding domain
MFALRRTLLLLAGCGLAFVVAVGASAPGRNVTRRAAVVTPAATISATPPGAIALTDGWRYLADPGNVGLARHWATGGAAKLGWSRVAVPSVFNPVISNTSYHGTVGWYKVSFMAPPASQGRSWEIRFEEVRRRAEVWLNGTQLGSSSDAYAPFSLPATSLVPSRLNTLVVRVEDLIGRGSFPEDWWNWGGIVRPVTLEPLGRLVFHDLGVMPELSCNYRCGDLLVEGTLQNISSVPLTPGIEVRSVAPSGLTLTWLHRVGLLAPGATVSVRFRVPVHGPPDLWAPGHPSLYKVSVMTLAQNRVEQATNLQVGMRSVRVRNGVLYLNGRRLWLHGASIHEDMPGRGPALTSGDIDTIVSELRSAGANITRSHYLLNSRLLDALDAAGIMVWSQPPVDHADPVLRTAAGRAQALEMLKATILGERSHASVVINSVGNELSPNPGATPGTRAYLDQAIPLARALDPTSPVALDIYCYPGFPVQPLYSKLDVIGISSYFGWYTGVPGHTITDFSQLSPFLTQTHARYPAQALVVAEFGAEGLFDGDPSTKGSYQFQSAYLQNTMNVISQLPFMNGAIYWTLREFAVNPGWTGGAQLPADDPPDGLHHKGLIAYDGTPKPAYAVAQQLFADPPAFAR